MIFRTIAAIAVAAAISAPAAAQTPPSGVYQMDPTHARMTWQARHLGLADYTAWFDSFSATITIDADNPENSSVVATVDPTSVNTGLPNFDAEIGGEFLRGAEFPEATFTSTSVEMTGDQTAVVTGDLTLMGVTQEVTFDATLVGVLDPHPFVGRPAIAFSAVAEIDRTAFGSENLLQQVPNGEPVLGQTVTLTIDAEFIQAE